MPTPELRIVVCPSIWADDPATQRLIDAYDEWFNSLRNKNQKLVNRINRELDRQILQGVSSTTIKSGGMSLATDGTRPTKPPARLKDR